MNCLLETIVSQLRDLADDDDQLGRGEFQLLNVSSSGPDSFIIQVADHKSLHPRTFRIQIREEK